MKEIKKEIKKKRGFVILFAVTLAAILLSIALGVAQVALKEIKFGTSAKDTNEAFFAADTGAEQALYNDKGSSSLYVLTPPETTHIWMVVVSGLGNAGLSCANVNITKTDNGSGIQTIVVSKGYNVSSPSCNSTSSNTVERELDVNY